MTLLLLQITFGSVASRERGAQASSRRMLRLVLGVDGVVVVASFREGLAARARVAMRVVLEAVEVAVLGTRPASSAGWKSSWFRRPSTASSIFL